jgi:hypothetical protein
MSVSRSACYIPVTVPIRGVVDRELQTVRLCGICRVLVRRIESEVVTCRLASVDVPKVGKLDPQLPDHYRARIPLIL